MSNENALVGLPNDIFVRERPSILAALNDQKICCATRSDEGTERSTYGPDAGLTEHLGCEPDGKPTSQQVNRCNGSPRKTPKGHDGVVPIDVPRDSDGSFEPERLHVKTAKVCLE